MHLEKTNYTRVLKHLGNTYNKKSQLLIFNVSTS